MDRRIVSLSVTAICVGLATAGCIPGETPEYSFATWQDAVASGQTGTGKWIPSDIPASAVDIRATYAIDSSHTLVAFRVPNASEQHAPQRCKPDLCGEGEYFALLADRGYFWRH